MKLRDIGFLDDFGLLKEVSVVPLSRKLAELAVVIMNDRVYCNELGINYVEIKKRDVYKSIVAANYLLNKGGD